MLHLSMQESFLFFRLCIFQKEYAEELIYIGAEEGSWLIERKRGCSFKEACKTSDIGFLK